MQVLKTTECEMHGKLFTQRPIDVHILDFEAYSNKQYHNPFNVKE